MGVYRILCLDGGGVRGLYSSVLLSRLADEVPTLVSGTDFLAGTSTGSIIALGLAEGLQPADLVAWYKENIPSIFDDSFLRDVRDLGGLIGAKYDNSNLKTSLTNLLGSEMTLGQLRKRVLVPAFQLDNGGGPTQAGTVRRWKPKFFHNFPGPDSDGTELVLDVAMRSSAAPTYFPSYKGYIDGAVVANNPGMCALAQAIDPGRGNQRLADIRILSLGTGTHPTFISGQSLDWGFTQWAMPLTVLMIDGSVGVVDYQCTQFLGVNFRRLDPLLPEVIQLDDAGKVDDLIALANAVDLSETVEWLRDHFQSSPVVAQ
jgi:patatin-like phospholipase/acyl hydrolase